MTPTPHADVEIEKMRAEENIDEDAGLAELTPDDEDTDAAAAAPQAEEAAPEDDDEDSDDPDEILIEEVLPEDEGTVAEEEGDVIEIEDLNKEEEEEEEIDFTKPDPPNCTEDYMNKKIMWELDGIDKTAREAYEDKKYFAAYGSYKQGLRSCSDLVYSKRGIEPELMILYHQRRRVFSLNAAVACIKVGAWKQAREAADLVLEHPDSDMQRVKALYRGGVACRGRGDLEDAKPYLRKVLEDDAADDRTKREAARQLRGIRKEKEDYKKMAGFLFNSKESKEGHIFPKPKDWTEEELMAKAEEEMRMSEYIQRQKDNEERARKALLKNPYAEPPMEYRLSEEKCLEILKTLAERYAAPSVQYELKMATYDHSFEMTKGFIQRARKVMWPLQRDLLLDAGFLSPEDDASGDDHARSRALNRLQMNTRYLGWKNAEIKETGKRCQKLGMGPCMASYSGLSNDGEA